MPQRPMSYLKRMTLLSACVLGITAGWAAQKAQPPPLPVEQLTVEALAPQGPHRTYVVDEAFNNEIDSRVFVYDPDTYRVLGQIGAGFYPSAILSPDGKTTAVATTYFSRGTRGQRTDLIELTDNATLTVTGEIVLPPKRALTLPTIFSNAYSDDGRRLYVSYITPASSFGVLDPIKKTVLSEIETAGCVLVIPSGANRVSSLCESGRLLTVTLNSQGKEVSRVQSEPFFNADTDPVFVQGVPSRRGYTFISFLGQVHDVDFSGPKPAATSPWSLVSDSERGRWRPGGVQVAAIHRSLGRVYVPMHQGGDGSHKEGGTEIWVTDTTTHKRLARWAVDAKQHGTVIAIQVSQDQHPVVLAATDQANVLVYDGLTGALRHVQKQLGQTPWLILTP